MAKIEIKNLHVSVGDKEVLNGVNMILESGKVNVLMGPNGSGKSSLANALAGNPKFKITSGKIIFNGEDITNLGAFEKAKKGIFLSFQHPVEVEGVSIINFLKTAYNSVKDENVSIIKFRKMIKERAELIGLDDEFIKRNLNKGFSGGEKKKVEMLSLLVLDPVFAILDEVDSGLDIDSLKVVSKGIEGFIDGEKFVLIVTHYKRILDYVRPDKVFVMKSGRIVREGDGELVDVLEKEGYREF